jgi:hypothetical protein
VSEPEHAWPFYCEENVWHACARPVAEGREAYALFVSNAAGQVAMWSQRAAPEGRPIVWDYHAVLLERTAEGWTVRDDQCRRGVHLPLRDWLDASFRSLPPAAERFAPRFRLVPADRFRETLSTDRSHMREGDDWRHPPPPWPPIGRGTNLMRFVDMEAELPGAVVDLAGLRARFGLR